ncbi:hypothetical protein Mapa_007783 [Marchantia paleacea]|nr:hypothetical protein Mapa_007783 [Marchantia paleacea]
MGRGPCTVGYQPGRCFFLSSCQPSDRPEVTSPVAPIPENTATSRFFYSKK